MINGDKNNINTVLVIFGATGDLAKNKIIPAVLDLKEKKVLPDQFKIVGFSRKDLSDDDYREFIRNTLDQKGSTHSEFSLDSLLRETHYVQGDINDSDSYDKLKKYLKQLDDNQGVCANKLFYLAVPPNLYEPILMNLDEAKLIKPCASNSNKNWTRLLIEKPFGSDLKEAQKLDKLLGKLFDDEQVFRIDHYLAKEAVQNIIAFRFANAIFEPIWNADLIEKIEINLFEKSDVSSRSDFYDSVGALRDVGQNHALQLLALVAMDDPKGLSAQKIQQARSKLLAKVSPFSKNPLEYAVRAQYRGYQKHEGVAKNSKTETFFRLKLKVDDKRWKGVPFYITSGKALSEDKVEIVVSFREKESCVCPVDDICHYGNTITISIQPEELISICFWKKTQGLDFGLEQKKLSFSYENGEKVVTKAYEKVLYDCLTTGDQILFPDTKEIMAQWAIITKINEQLSDLPVVSYDPGANADDLAKLK